MTAGSAARQRSIAISREHREFAATVRDFAAATRLGGAARAAADAMTDTATAKAAAGNAAAAASAADSAAPDRPAFWLALARLGLLGVAVAERHSGQGYGAVEAAIVLEELARTVAPGPLLSTMTAAAVMGDAAGGIWGDAAARIATGEATAAFAVAGAGELPVTGARDAQTTGGLLAAGGAADVVLVVCGGELWLFDREQVSINVVPGIDRTSPLARVRLTGPPAAERRLAGAGPRALAVFRTLAAAQAAGGAAAVTDATVEYAMVRHHFGRRGRVAERDRPGAGEAHRRFSSGQASLREHARRDGAGPGHGLGCRASD